MNRIVFVGAGKVATQLGTALAAQDYIVSEVCSPGAGTAAILAPKLGARAVAGPEEVPDSGGIYIFCVPDDALPAAIKAFSGRKGIAVHTAGSVSLAVFSAAFNHYGVLYPLQTFSPGKKVDLGTVPFLIEASDPETLETVRSLAASLSGEVRELTGEKRKMIHLAAVFACNFSNHMVALGKFLLDEEGIDRSLLDPLIGETFEKLRHLEPEKAQTGPAVRGDQGTMAKHIQMLEKHTDLKNLYIFISQNIAELKARQNSKNTVDE